MASVARRIVHRSVSFRPSASPLLPSRYFSPAIGPTTSCASAEASEFRAADSEHIAAEKIPATRYAETKLGRWRTLKVGKISSEAWKAPAEAGSIERQWKKAKSRTPIDRKRLIWRKTTKPLQIRAFCASRRPRQARSRCTINWSAPWLAIERNVPPSTPAQNV